jgi:SAM-dependent methyltransferase
MGRWFVILAFALALAMEWPGSDIRALAQAGARQKPALDVPFEPSTRGITRAMLDMARVTSADVVYDLGCGDGRIVIMAARERQAKGVGVDLDPVRVEESKKHAGRAGVTGLVQFFQQNLFETDIARATVVMLYLWPEVNLRLRPKLLSDLRPGTRIVSHSHTMGDWTPDDQRTVEGHDLYLFIVPANATGTWRWTDRTGRETSLRVTQKFQQGECRMEAGKDPFTVKNCALRGDLLTFSSAAGDRVLLFEGRIAGDVIRGQVRDSAGQRAEAWKAFRDPSTRQPIAE